MTFKEFLEMVEHLDPVVHKKSPSLPSMKGAKLMAKGATRPAHMADLSADKLGPSNKKFMGMTTAGPVYKDVRPAIHRPQKKF